MVSQASHLPVLPLPALLARLSFAMSNAAALRANATDKQDDPRYAWVMLPLAMMMQIGTSPGQTFGVSLFNEPIRHSLGLSHSLLTGSYLVASILAAAPLMSIGRQMDRRGIKWVSLALVTLVGLACVVVGNVTNIIGLTIGFFMLRAFGQGGLSLAASNSLGMWFHRRLGVASGIMGVGMSVAIAVTPLVYLQLIESLGWRLAYVAIGLATWFVMLPIIAVVYRDNPTVDESSPTGESSSTEALGLRPEFDVSSAMRTPAYLIAAGCTALTGFICTAVFFNLVPLFELQGLTASQAAGVFPTVAVTMALLQIKGGLLADRLPLGWLLAVAMACLGAGVFVVGNAPTIAIAHVAAALIGAGQGLMAVTGNTLWPRYFGRRHLGAIRSSVWTATVAACSVGPFVMGVTRDVTGNYGPSVWLMVSLAGVAAFAAAAWVTAPAPPLRAELVVSSS